jgi:hypothetical membrane protein
MSGMGLSFGDITVRLAGILVGVPWAFVSTWSGLAIPETLSALVIFIWVIAEVAKLCVGK